jgi:hypothetical protein
MKPIDFLVAGAVAIGLLITNVLIVVLAVSVYAVLIAPGHPTEFYNAAAQRIAPWCVHTVGTALFLGAGWLFARRRPGRNGYLFAASFSLLYAIFDGASVGFVGVLNIEFASSMLANFLAAPAGAWVGARDGKSPRKPGGEL